MQGLQELDPQRRLALLRLQPLGCRAKPAQVGDPILDALELRPRRRSFGNARLAQREEVLVEDVPKSGAGRTKIGFLQ